MTKGPPTTSPPSAGQAGPHPSLSGREQGVQCHSWGVLGAVHLCQGEGNVWDSVNTRECVMWLSGIGRKSSDSGLCRCIQVRGQWARAQLHGGDELCGCHTAHRWVWLISDPHASCILCRETKDQVPMGTEPRGSDRKGATSTPAPQFPS